jgi:hypothetical protein
MPMNAPLFPSLLVLFVLSMAGGWLLVHLVDRRAGRMPDPPSGARVRIRSTLGIHRCHFLQTLPDGWSLSCPISRDAYVPIRIGERLTLEVATPEGLLLYQTTLLDRNTDPHRLLVARPDWWTLRDRRGAGRLEGPGLPEASLEGERTVLADLSVHGARGVTSARCHSGERVRLDVPWRSDPIFAWVLEARTRPSCEGQESEVRLRFEETVPLPVFGA